MTTPTPARYVTAHRVQTLERQLTPADWSVLRLLLLLDYATTKQIERACFTTGTPLGRARNARRHLRRLVRLGVLHQLPRTVGGPKGGSRQGVFTLDRGGWRLLVLRGEAPTRRYRHPEERGQAFLTHTLAVAEHHVALVEHLRGLPGAELLVWTPEPDCHTRFRYRARAERLTPDAYVEVRRGREAIASYLEVDRGTESLPTLLRKCRTYLRCARIAPDCPQVVISFDIGGRVDRLREALPGLAKAEGVSPAMARQLFALCSPTGAVHAVAGEEARP